MDDDYTPVYPICLRTYNMYLYDNLYAHFYVPTIIVL